MTGLRATHAGTTALLTWDASPAACTSYVVLASDALPTLLPIVTDLVIESHSDSSPLGPSRLRAFSIRADSPVKGTGDP